MLHALVSGTADPEILADLARGLLRKKISALREALVGRFEDEHALVIGQILAHINFLVNADTTTFVYMRASRVHGSAALWPTPQ